MKYYERNKKKYYYEEIPKIGTYLVFAKNYL